MTDKTTTPEPIVRSWATLVAESIAEGCKTIAPNGLPVACIRHDGVMLATSRADHGYGKDVLQALDFGSPLPVTSERAAALLLVFAPLSKTLASTSIPWVREFWGLPALPPTREQLEAQEAAIVDALPPMFPDGTER